MEAMRYFLITPKRYIKNFSFLSDREYFSKPVEVKMLATYLDRKMYYVRDENRKHEYPALIEDVHSEYRLTRKQRIAAGIDCPLPNPAHA